MNNPVIGIIGGKGRMGKLFVNFFNKRGIKVKISDKNTKLSNKNIAKTADIAIISVPIDKTEKIINEIIKEIPKRSAIMDFTSVKEMPVKAMLKGKCEVLGMHPMFGDSNPVPGQTIILCHTKKSGKWSKWMEDFLEKNQVKIQKMTPEKHDKVMNIAQGLIHFADITFADALRRTKMRTEDILKYTGKASELRVQLAGRIMDQDPNLYGNIQIRNKNALKSLNLYKKAVNELIQIVNKKDLKAFEKYFNRNKEYFDKYTKEAYEDSSYLIDKLMEKQRAGKANIVIKPRKNDIAVLGPKNTFSDLAADSYIEKNKLKNNKFFTKDIDEACELTEKGKVKFAIIPIENKLNGTIRETIDNLFNRNIEIIKEIKIPIHHSLIILPHAKKHDIKTIMSHPQALKQCKNYIKKTFPKAQLERVNSTTAAIEFILSKNEKSLAAIGPEKAGRKSGLKILKTNIEDRKDNETTFIIIEKPQRKPRNSEQKNRTKTSIAFHFSTDAPGTLFTVFKDFADAKINMTKIESRPTKAKFGDYIFYLDFEGSITDPKIKKTLKKVEKKVAKLKILGSYQ